MFLSSAELIREAIGEVILSGEQVDLAIAYWGTGAVQELGLAQLASGSRVLLHATSGNCNPRELMALQRLAPRVEVRHCEGLHAKVVRGESCAIVGSANASAAGLDFAPSQSPAWIEAATEVTAPRELRQIRAWFYDLWLKALPLSPDLIAEAEALWSRQRNAQRLIGASPELLIPNGGIHVALHSDDAEEGVIEAAVALADAAGIKGADAYQNWKRMPKDAVLISFEVDQSGSGGPQLEGIWRSLPEPVHQVRVGRSTKSVSIVLKEKSLALSDLGISQAELARRVRGLIGSFEQRGSGAKAAVMRCGGEYRNPRDWCIAWADFEALCEARLKD